MHGKHMKILVVDDSATVRRIIRAELTSAGYHVEEAASGPKAIELYSFQPQFDLITLDVNLASGDESMDGFETLKHLRRIEAVYNILPTPVVFITGSDTIEGRARGFELGAKDFILKPFNKGEILTAVNHILEPSPELSGHKILVVDDTKLARSIIARTLREEGAEVLEASSGLKGFELTGSHRDALDMVITSLSMPGMNGDEYCNKVRNELEIKELPIIVLTENRHDSRIITLFKNGATEYISKPFIKEELLSRLKVHLERARVSRRLNKTIQQLEESLETLRATQNQLVESEKMALLGKLVAGVAHEVNTPVSIGITGASSLLDAEETIRQAFESDEITEEQFTEFLDLVRETGILIQRNMQRTGDLISSFKQVSADESSGRVRDFNLRSYLNDIVNSLKPRLKKQNVMVGIQCDKKTVLYSDPGVFAQIFTNLIINSLTHAFPDHDSGLITIETTVKNDRIQLSYRDSGKGISSDILPRIWEPFFTTNQAIGTGLGMHIIQNLVSQKLNGTIECSSEPGKGVLFLIDIPYSKGSNDE